MKLKHFETPEDVLDYVFTELVDTLTDDLNNMEGDERRHYTDEDRREMRGKLADIRATAALIMVAREWQKERIACAAGKTIQHRHPLIGLRVWTDDPDPYFYPAANGHAYRVKPRSKA